MNKFSLSASLALLITTVAIITEWTGLKKTTPIILPKTAFEIWSLWPIWLFIFIVSLSLIYILLSRKKIILPIVKRNKDGSLFYNYMKIKINVWCKVLIRVVGILICIQEYYIVFTEHKLKMFNAVMVSDLTMYILPLTAPFIAEWRVIALSAAKKDIDNQQ